MKEIFLQDNPDVSIIVPVFNGAKFVAQTLSCLLGQTYGNIEVIVVNDGSTDNSKQIIDQFSYDRRLWYFEKENGGTGSALNLGHTYARAPYVTWCSADNVYLPQFVELLKYGLDAAKNAGQNVQLVYSDFCFINESGQKIRDVIHQKAQSGEDLIEGYDVGISFMYTRELYNLAGPYWTKICEDFNFAVKAAQHTQFGLINAVLAGFRVHGAQITGSKRQEEMAAAQECKELARKLFGGQ